MAYKAGAKRSRRCTAESLKGNPLHRIGDTHDDIGATVAFLLSDDASYLNAQTIHIDGGMGSFR